MFAAEGGVDSLIDSERASLAPPEGLIASPEPDWPQRRGPRRDGISSETGLLRSWPAGGPRLVWKAGSLGQGWSSPIVVGQRLYITGDVGDDLFVYAFELNGSLRWRKKTGCAWTGSFPGGAYAPVCSRKAASITGMLTAVWPAWPRRLGRGALGRRGAGSVSGGEHHVGPGASACWWTAKSGDPLRPAAAGIYGGLRQAERPHGVGRGAPGSRPHVVCLADPVSLGGPPAAGQLLGDARLWSRRGQRPPAVARPAEESL